MLDAGCRMLDAGCRIPDPGSRIPDAGCGMLDARCRMLDAGCWIPDPGSRIPDAGCRMLDAGCRMPDAGSRIPDPGCRMLDATCWIGDLGEGSGGGVLPPFYPLSTSTWRGGSGRFFGRKMTKNHQFSRHNPISVTSDLHSQKPCRRWRRHGRWIGPPPTRTGHRKA